MSNLAQRIAALKPEKRKLLIERNPLSFAQQRLWFLDKMAPGGSFYNMQSALRFEGPFDMAAFARAINEVVRRHEVLRTVFIEVDGHPIQAVLPSLEIAVDTVDLSHLPAGERFQEAQRLAMEKALAPYDLTTGPLLRAAVFRLGAEDHVTLFGIHHIVTDGWSMRIVMSELQTLYEAFAAGKPSPLPELRIQYADFARWQRERLRGERLEQELAYWAGKLDSNPEPLQLPLDWPRPAVQTYRGAGLRRHFAQEFTTPIKALATAHHATPFMFFVAAVNTLFHRYTGQTDISIGTPIANRNHRDIEPLIGFFVNTLVLRTNLSGDPSFLTLMKRVREDTLEAYQHQELPFELLVEKLNPRRDPSRNPFFDVMFAMQTRGSVGGMVRSHGPAMSPADLPSETTRFDLEMHLIEKEGVFECLYIYNRDLFSKETVARLATCFDTLIRSILRNPEARLSEFDVVEPAERRRLLFEWNQTTSDYPRTKTIGELFDEQAKAAPEAMAVVFQGERLTYAELKNQSDRLANYLLERGVKPDTLVGLCMERSARLVVAILGILKAGAAYVPLDASYPQPRLAHMLEDTAAPVVLLERRFAEVLPGLGYERIYMDADWDRVMQAAPSAPVSAVAAENLAYVMYTSGSTGVPKGVAVTHRNVVRLVRNTNYARFGPDEVFLLLAPISFDASTFELWGALLNGARLEVFPPETPTLETLGRFIRERGITTLWLTSGLFHQMADAQLDAFTKVRQLLAGGDVLNPAHVRRVLEAHPHLTLINGYGPTECTTFSCCHPMRSAEDVGDTVSIGRPISNAQVYILDSYLNPAPLGAVGELYIAGDGVARGYLNSPELTAERFIPIPFLDDPNARMYKTGDLVRYRADGRIDFLGRADTQVKIRGFRIELGEIETALTEHPGVSQAIVVADGVDSDQKRLVAYIVPNKGYQSASAQSAGQEAAGHVAQWKALYEDTYGQAGALPDPTFNIIGWNSSYTGEPIPADEMRQWVDDTVNSIRALNPRRPYEIGCGTGLLLFRLAPHCERYAAVDFSETAVRGIERAIENGLAPQSVSVSRRLADDFTGVEPRSHDVVIINSVTQYFPDVDYLRRVIEGAIDAVEDGGAVFVGDVRSLPLLEAYHASVQYHSADASTARDELRDRVRLHAALEEELVIDPAFFFALKACCPRISHVEVRPKRGRYHNELSRFRYQVVLHIGKPAPPAPQPLTLDWEADALTLETLERRLAEEDGEAVLIRGIPNARLALESAALRWLASNEGPLTKADFERMTVFDGVEPEDVYEVADRTGWNALMSWANHGADGRYDALFERRPAPAHDFTPQNFAPQSWEAYTNAPMQAAFARNLVPELREHVAARLPEYMTPNVFMMIDRIPLTPNGKVDRKALPKPESVRSAHDRSYVAPETPTEIALAAIWRDTLNAPKIGVEDNFFDLGGHSLLATQVVSRIRNEFGVETPLRVFFADATIRGLASYIRNESKAKAPAAPPLRAMPRGDTVPLSFAQQRLWFLDQWAPGNPFYVTPSAVRLKGPLDVDALTRALNEVARRHETLRTAFIEIDGTPMQVIHPAAEIRLERIDVSHLPEEEREREARRLAGEKAREPFDLTKSPLLRAALVKIHGEDHALLLAMHHIISDGWSMGVLVRELTALYEAFSHGKPSPLPPLPAQYADFALWQRAWLQGEALEAQLDYWRERLAGDLPRLDLPADHPRPPVQSFRGGTEQIQLSRELSSALYAFSQEQRVTLFMAMLTAFKTLLYRYTGQEDIVIGSPIANRNRAEIEGLIGFFVNSMVMRTDLSGDPTFLELLRRVEEAALGAFAHQDLPFELLVEKMNPERDMSRNPFFDIMFAVQNAPRSATPMGAVRAQSQEYENRVTRFDLEAHVWEAHGLIRLNLLYSTDLFEAETIRRLARHYVALLESMIANPRQPISKAPMLNEDERRQLLVEWNGPAHPLDLNRLVPERVVEIAARNPERLAISDGRRALTYGELDARSNALAHRLRAAGVVREDFVVVLMERCVDAPVAMLAIWKAGAVYVPLDPAYPEARVAFIIEDTAAKVVLTQQALLRRAPNTQIEVIAVDTFTETSAAPPEFIRRPEDLAYAIYTSGSTGQPKAALIEHRGLLNLVSWHVRTFGVTAKDRATLIAGPAFDASVWELWPYLSAGASLHIPSGEIRASSHQLLEWLSQTGITIAFLPTPLAEVAMDEIWPAECRVRYLLTGGDKLHFPPGPHLPFKLVNNYGPTENTVVTTSIIVPPGRGKTPPPIGRPIDNTRVYVLDAHLQPVPIGAPGELHIAGPGLARGYLNRPDLTREKFVADPFGGDPAARMYKTGDRARWRADGVLEFIDRIDTQVKLRGYRVELGEIESALLEHPGVAQSAVIAYGDGEQKRLAAYVVPDPAYIPEDHADGDGAGSHINQWRMLYEETYGQNGDPEDPCLNIAGWNSSYTGAPIPREEMRQWAERTAQAILARKPRRPLEIGCGTGLLLFRIAPRCESYAAVDFSETAVRSIQRAIGEGMAPRSVRVWQGLANDFSRIKPRSHDAVIINSVVQYFPSAGYLCEVIEGAVEAAQDGGFIYVGDVRSLPLLEAYHVSVQLVQAEPGVSRQELRDRVRRRMAQEEELVIDPAFFFALRKRIPRITHVEIRPKPGRYRNELTRFRYEVILHVAKPADAAAFPQPLDWIDSGFTLDTLRETLATCGGHALYVRNIPNARLVTERAAQRWIESDSGPETVGEFLNSLMGAGVEPEDITALAEELGWSVSLSWAYHQADGGFDAVFDRGAAPLRDFTPEGAVAKPWKEYTNNPLQAVFTRKLAPRLREHLSGRLPEYMIPTAFITLDTLPLTPNGKVDVKALPKPDMTRADLGQAYVAPSTPIERSLAEIWQQTLNLPQIGAHDNFFDVGGHSLLATQVVSRIREEFHVELPIRALFEAPTIATLAGTIERSQAVGASDRIERAGRAAEDDLLERLHEMSEEEIESLLAEMSDEGME